MWCLWMHIDESLGLETNAFQLFVLPPNVSRLSTMHKRIQPVVLEMSTFPLSIPPFLLFYYPPFPSLHFFTVPPFPLFLFPICTFLPYSSTPIFPFPLFLPISSLSPISFSALLHRFAFSTFPPHFHLFTLIFHPYLSISPIPSYFFIIFISFSALLHGPAPSTFPFPHL